MEGSFRSPFARLEWTLALLTSPTLIAFLFLAQFIPSANAQLKLEDAEPSQIAYGIEFYTTNASDNESIKMTLKGTKGTSKPFGLNNLVDNFQLDKRDYFLVSAKTIGDIGMPTQIYLYVDGHDGDGWIFKETRVDIYVTRRTQWLVEHYEKHLRETQNVPRKRSYRSFVQEVLIKRWGDPIITVKFPGAGGVDTDGDPNPEGVRLERWFSLKAE